MDVPQLSIMIIYISTWSILIQYIRIILSSDNLTSKTQKKDPFTSLDKIKANLPHWAEFEILRKGALNDTVIYADVSVWVLAEYLDVILPSPGIVSHPRKQESFPQPDECLRIIFNKENEILTLSLLWISQKR